MIESEITNFFYRHGYTPEFTALHSYKGKMYDCLTFSNGFRDRVIDCVYLSENEVLIGKVRYVDTPLSSDLFNRLKRIQSSEENLNLFIEESDIFDDAGVDTTEVIAEIKARKGQQIYRDKLMILWEGRCALSNLDIPAMLVGSHAKAWQYSDDKERLDEYNGFLFEARIDKLFDKYLISFDDEGKILISRKLNAEQRMKLGLSGDMHLRWISSRHLPYLAFHRGKFHEEELE